MMLLGFRIVDVQSNVNNLVLESFLSVSDMYRFSGRAVAERWP